MTDREHRLRVRIADLYDEVSALRAAKRNGSARQRHCVYCGQRCRSTACALHVDLLAVDPYYAEAA